MVNRAILSLPLHPARCSWNDAQRVLRQRASACAVDQTLSAGNKPLHVKDGHRLRKSLQHDRADVLQRGRFPNRSGHAAGDEDLAVFSFPTQASGEIAHRSDRGVAGTVSKTDLAQRGIPLRNPCAKAEFTVALPPSGD